MRVLLVEDDARLSASLAASLRDAGYAVDTVGDGEQAELFAEATTYDGIILDVMLPKRDGVLVCRTLRAYGLTTPILMLTARDTVEDTVSGLDCGADDYLRKPFVFRELEARLRSITRREPVPAPNQLRVEDLTMDLASRRVKRGDREVPLTARETAFLEYLMRNAGLLVTRPMLENALWERDRETASNLIEVYMRRLRAKLGAAGESSLIQTVRGSGYRFGPPDKRG